MAKAKTSVDRVKSGRKRGADTAVRLLDAAEALFSAGGFQSVSMRAIAAAAGTNVSASYYHFQSKEALYSAVIERRFRPLMDRRLELLGLVEAKFAAGAPPTLFEVLSAFIQPSIELLGDPDTNVRGLHQSMLGDSSPEVRDMVSHLMTPAANKFVDLAHRLCGHLDAEEFKWRIVLVISTVRFGPVVDVSMGADAGPDAWKNSDSAVSQLVEGLEAGLMAPSLLRSAA